MKPLHDKSVRIQISSTVARCVQCWVGEIITGKRRRQLCCEDGRSCLVDVGHASLVKCQLTLWARQCQTNYRAVFCEETGTNTTAVQSVYASVNGNSTADKWCSGEVELVHVQGDIDGGTGQVRPTDRGFVSSHTYFVPLRYRHSAANTTFILMHVHTCTASVLSKQQTVQV